MEAVLIKALYQSLVSHFHTQPLGVAGRLIYYDEEVNAFILGIHTTGAEKTHQVAEKVWQGLPNKLKESLAEAGIGFAIKQI